MARDQAEAALISSRYFSRLEFSGQYRGKQARLLILDHKFQLRRNEMWLSCYVCGSSFAQPDQVSLGKRSRPHELTDEGIAPARQIIFIPSKAFAYMLNSPPCFLAALSNPEHGWSLAPRSTYRNWIWSWNWDTYTDSGTMLDRNLSTSEP